MKSKQNLLLYILEVKHSKNLKVKPGGKTPFGQMLSDCCDHKTLKIYDFHKYYFSLSYSVLFFPFGIVAIVTFLDLKQERENDRTLGNLGTRFRFVG